MTASETTLIVALCTHNPREAAMSETLRGLRAQTLDKQSWELVIIDNGSAPPLNERLDLSWHPRARVVREDTLGIAPARLRALNTATEGGHELLLFVDDDNALAPDYLSEGLRLAREWPHLGCWGGQLLARYEVPPPEWFGNYEKYLAIFPLEKPMWTNRIASYDFIPPSAGTFIRRRVWSRYLQEVASQPLRLTLGPKGKDRIGGEDMDLMLCAIDEGLGLGRFPSLRLEHLIPKERITAQYVESLIASIFLGTDILEYIRYGRVPGPVHRTLTQKLQYRWQIARLTPPWKGLYEAETRGKRRALELISEWERKKGAARP